MFSDAIQHKNIIIRGPTEGYFTLRSIDVITFCEIAFPLFFEVYYQITNCLHSIIIRC